MTPPLVDPFTVLFAEELSVAEIESRIHASRERHAETLQRFHEIWYNAGHTWNITTFLGISVMKSPNDLWTYQELLARYRFRTVVETGTCSGGSALWFAFLMDALNIEGGRVLTVDYLDKAECHHPRITFFEGDSTNPALVEALRREIEYPLLVSLDSDHSAAHVKRELDLYAPAVRVGDWLVVEDTNVGWDGIDRGARGGLEDYLRAHPGEFRQDVICEKHLLTGHPGGWLQRVGECSHA